MPYQWLILSGYQVHIPKKVISISFHDHAHIHIERQLHIIDFQSLKFMFSLGLYLQHPYFNAINKIEHNIEKNHMIWILTDDFKEVVILSLLLYVQLFLSN
ncbi:hypothetical protein V6Z11_D02G133400 [Gossypium hirsutum]